LQPAQGEEGAEDYVAAVPNPKYLTPFQKLLLLKVLKPDKLSLGIAEYIINGLDQRFVEVPPLRLSDIFPDTSPTVPVIFILTTGADPTGMLLDFCSTGQDPEKHQSQVRAPYSLLLAACCLRRCSAAPNDYPDTIARVSCR